MEGDSKPSDALHHARLCTQMPSTAVGISQVVKAADVSMPPCSNTELVEFASASDRQPSRWNLVSSRISRLMQMRSEYATAVEFEIEASKVHWSELDSTNSDEDEENQTDVEVFQKLKEKWGDFFCDYGDGLVMGKKIAEGGQAEIYEASWSSRAIFKLGEQVGGFDVLKVFKEGWALQHLQKQWPEGMLQAGTRRGPIRRACVIDKGVMLNNGRFAFLMKKYWGDLRKLIDIRMQHNHNACAPFTDDETGSIAAQIVEGMAALHKRNIVHRDMKASNILLWVPNEKTFDAVHDPFWCNVADFESSVGLVGTGYWRAPEILRALQTGSIRSHLFDEKSDVYSFAMTYYEILTGCIPFEDLGGRNYGMIIEGRRPELPSYINPLLKALLNRCWHTNPLERPSFGNIGEQLKKIYLN
ncbi:hypothetical protein KC19_6G194100 [Ceratodon purpureus]|uniref:Protein kinase domain-containing protein n=1 Tax=Ceratodon purpureus TaxID=3225 RepID=A0A8T0HJA9_CERPU|nr:hypothetical protein KC19_6G194100 [Ceratodon purpureus]KAG0570877.1 hypothetical protein KC19_6G194100 [Ceratodon purpureus]